MKGEGTGFVFVKVGAGTGWTKGAGTGFVLTKVVGAALFAKIGFPNWSYLKIKWKC